MTRRRLRAPATNEALIMCINKCIKYDHHAWIIDKVIFCADLKDNYPDQLWYPFYIEGHYMDGWRSKTDTSPNYFFWRLPCIIECGGYDLSLLDPAVVARIESIEAARRPTVSAA